MNIFTKRSDVKVLDNCIICKLTLNMTLHLGSKNGTLIWVTLYIQHILNVYTTYILVCMWYMKRFE